MICPPEVCGEESENVLDKIRAHYEDLKSGQRIDAEITCSVAVRIEIAWGIDLIKHGRSLPGRIIPRNQFLSTRLGRRGDGCPN
jgi:hypothetical protein